MCIKGGTQNIIEILTLKIYFLHIYYICCTNTKQNVPQHFSSRHENTLRDMHLCIRGKIAQIAPLLVSHLHF